MSITKSHLLIALSFFLATPLCAEPSGFDIEILEKPVSITGFVEAPDGARVPGAWVEILETGQMVASDAKGWFRFPTVWHAKVTLKASNPDYEAVTLKPIDVSKPSSEPLRIRFEHLRSFESTVVITGTRDERLIKDVPVRTEVVTAEAIEKKAAVTLAEAIDGTTGLRVENNCQNCGFNSLRINGLEGNYSHILLNGLPAFSSMASVYGLEQVPTIMVERIEVIKGGASALYGASAVGGVVNVITKRPSRTAASLEASYSNADGEGGGSLRGYGSWVGSRGSTAVFAFGNLSKADPYDRNADGFSDTPYKSLESGGVRFFRRALSDAAELEVSYDASHEDRRGGEMNLGARPHETELTEWSESTRSSFSAKWDHFLSGASHYTVHIIHTRTDRDTYYGGGFDPKAYGSTVNPNTNFAASYFHKVSAHNLQVGMQYEKDEITDSHPGYNRVIKGDYDNHGFFIQDDFKFCNSITLLAGVRIDKHSALRNPVLSPRVSALIALSDHFRIRTTISQGFKAPAVFDEDLHIEVSGGEPHYHINDPDLKAERATSLSLSGEYSNYISGELSTRIEANFFYTKLRNTFVNERISEEDDNIVLFMRINGGSSRVCGLEFNADVEFPGGFDVEAGLTLQRSRLDEPEPDFGSIEYLRTPRTYGYLMSSYLHRLFSVNARLEYTGGMWAPHYAGYIEKDRLEKTPAFVIINSHLEVPLVRSNYRLGIVCNIYNITDEFQEDLDIGPDRDAGFLYGPRRPRTLFVGLKLDL